MCSTVQGDMSNSWIFFSCSSTLFYYRCQNLNDYFNYDSSVRIPFACHWYPFFGFGSNVSLLRCFQQCLCIVGGFFFPENLLKVNHHQCILKTVCTLSTTDQPLTEWTVRHCRIKQCVEKTDSILSCSRIEKKIRHCCLLNFRKGDGILKQT